MLVGNADQHVQSTWTRRRPLHKRKARLYGRAALYPEEAGRVAPRTCRHAHEETWRHS